MKIPMYGCMGHILRRPFYNINSESAVSTDNAEKDSVNASGEVNNSKNFDTYKPSNEVKEDNLTATADGESEKTAGADARAEYTALLNFLREQSANNNMQLPQAVKYDPETEKHIIRKPIDPEVAERMERKRQSKLLVDTIRSRNDLIGRLHNRVVSGNLGYSATIKLFNKELTAWERNLQNSNTEAYKLWIDFINMK
ncbi:MAG: hypothetical protein HFE90_07695 [Firmicutes bacterium]|nr:hypothetical protein [Bacillota bacterium]